MNSSTYLGNSAYIHSQKDRLGLTLHASLNCLHSTEDLSEPIVDFDARSRCLDCIKDLESAADEGAGVLNHVDVGQDKASLGALRVQAPLEGADEAEVGVLHALCRVGEVIIEEGVRSSIRQEGRDVQPDNISPTLYGMGRIDQGVEGRREDKRGRHTTRHNEP